MHTENVPEPVSIIVPTLNEKSYLPLLLDSLLRNDYPFEVIIVDGSSDDETSAIAERYRERFFGLQSLQILVSERRNIAIQRNLGAEAARNDVLVFVDADVVMPSGALRQMVEEFIAREYVAANPQFSATAAEDALRYKWLWAFIHFGQKVMLRFGRPYFAGICLLTRRGSFIAAGKFDESLLLGEDTDYSFRVRPYGKCGLLPTRVPTSMRRLRKIGLREAAAIIRLLPYYIRTGRVPNSFVKYYPLGEH